MRWIPQRVSWLARIVEFEWNSHFVDVQVQGPFKEFRHRHGVGAEVRDAVEGTVVSDNIEYALPGGALGRLGERLVRAQMEKGFAFRQNRLPEILAAAARQAAQRQ